MSNRTQILLATLGGQPQIVTFTLDLLLSKGFDIEEVIVIHPRPADPRLQNSLRLLRAEFANNYYKVADRAIGFRSQVLSLDGEPLDDIIDDRHADGTLDTIHQLIGDLKRNGHHIHMSVSGGRRLMPLLAISVAALNFDHHDTIWHLYTPMEIQEQADEGAIMHVPIDAGIRLIKGPFISLGAYIYNQPQSFQAAHEGQRSRIDAQEQAKCAAVVRATTSGQLRVLQAFSRGLKAQQVAAELNIEPVTVHSHKTVLLRLCHNAWNIDPDEHLDYHFLQTKFAGYFEREEPGERD